MFNRAQFLSQTRNHGFHHISKRSINFLIIVQKLSHFVFSDKLTFARIQQPQYLIFFRGEMNMFAFNHNITVALAQIHH